MEKATSKNIQKTILESLIFAAKNHQQYCAKVHLGKAPEYYLNITIANEIARKYKDVGFYLEKPMRHIHKNLMVDGRKIKSCVAHAGRIDIALTDRKNSSVKYLIEVKRKLRMSLLLKDCKRIASMLHAMDASFARVGYVAAIGIKKIGIKKIGINKIGIKNASEKNFKKDINEMQKKIKKELLSEGFKKCSVKHLLHQSKAGAYGAKENEFLVFVVFKICL